MQTRITSTITGKIFGAATLLSILTLLLKILSLSKDAVIVSTFGLNYELDAFSVSLGLLGFYANLLGPSIAVVAIPLYVEFRHQRPDQGQRFVATVFVCVAVLATLMIVSYFLFQPQITALLSAGFSSDGVRLTQRLSSFIMVAVAASTFSALLATLQAREKFAIAGLTPGVIVVATLIATLVFALTLGIYSVAIGTIIGYGEYWLS